MDSDEQAMTSEAKSAQVEAALDVRAIAMLPGVYGDLMRLADDFERRYYDVIRGLSAEAQRALCADSSTNGGSVAEAFREAVARQTPPLAD